MKNNFVMFCKTYSADLNNFSLMIDSFNAFNEDNIKLFVSVPEKEINLYTKFNNKNISVITDESYAGNFFTNKSYHGLSTGYINQEICKLSFWESNIAENYLCIDSDLQFIRKFYISDFMADKNTPYTVLVMDKDLSIEKHYHDFWNFRQTFIKKIYDDIGLNDKRLRTCHGMQVLNSKVLKSLKKDFMTVKKYSYSDLIKISPYEFTWYNAWFQKCKLIKEVAVEPFFKTFHMRIDYIFSKLKLLNLSDLSYSYIGIIMNSNWNNKHDKYTKTSFFYKKLYSLLKRL